MDGKFLLSALELSSGPGELIHLRCCDDDDIAWIRNLAAEEALIAEARGNEPRR